MNDNRRDVKPWEIGVAVIGFVLLVGLVALGYVGEVRPL